MKLSILVRTDLKMSQGKLASQSSHAAVEAALKADKGKLKKWREEGSKKIILKVADEKELLDFEKKAKTYKLNHALIKDAGKTFFKEPTITCLAIGPDEDTKIDKITKNLKIL